MILSTLISLYTSRVVLQALGVTDFGIYNVVSGFVTMLAFVNGSLVAATRRYLTIALATDSEENQKQVFSSSFYLHLFVALLITIFAVTFGYWFIENRMVIPSGQIQSAKAIFTYSLFPIIALCITVPHNAIVIAHEKMGAFASLSLIEVFLKLGVAILIAKMDNNRLVTYALLVNLIAVFVRLLYVLYSHYAFSTVSYRMPRSLSLIKKMVSFSGWNLYSAMSQSIYQQGLNILLNIFYGPIVNAANAIAVQVQGLASIVATNFQQAVNPQITKTYATGDMGRLQSLVYKGTKFSYILVFCVTFPILIETDYVLQLWLGEYPKYTSDFVRFALLLVLSDIITNPLTTAILATGDIFYYKLIEGTIRLIIVGVVYIGLKLGLSPVGVYIVNLIIVILLYLIKYIIVSSKLRLNNLLYCKNVFLPITIFTLMSVLIFYLFFPMFNLSPILNIVIAVFSVIISILLFGLSKSEKEFIVQIIKTKINEK